MIGPPGLPKIGRRVSRLSGPPHSLLRWRLEPLKWAAGFYLAGVLAHFSHAMVSDLPGGIGHWYFEALSNAPMSLAWPADLIGTLMALG